MISMKFNEDVRKLIMVFCNKTYHHWKHLMDFDDYLQDSYLYILERINRYDCEKSKLGNYIWRILIRKWYGYKMSAEYKQLIFEKDMLNRKLGVDDKTSDDYDLEDCIEDDDISITEYINIMEKLDRFEKVIPMLKELTIQHYLFNIPQSKLAEKTNSSRQSVNAKIQRNLNNIKKYIDNTY
jgi:DNA-directed RNA polymerase specialized sigma24 family protein